MSQLTLESLAERLSALEKLVGELNRAQGKTARTKDWRSTLGMFAGDEAMKEIDRLGQEIRDAEGPEDEE